MWELTVPWWEPVIRGTVIYFSVFILIRFLGKKPIGQPAPFDFILLLIISEAVSNALSGEDASLPAAIITASTLIGWNYLMDYLAFKSTKAEMILEGKEQLLIKDGKINEEVRRKEEITHHEIESAVREHGFLKVEEVSVGMLENNGKISIIPKNKSKPVAPTKYNENLNM